MIEILGARVLLRKHQEKELVRSGIVIPGTKNASVYDVVSIGDASVIEPGSRVVVEEHTPDPVDVDGEDLWVCDDADVLAYVR